jgi:hypothetical protein
MVVVKLKLVNGNTDVFLEEKFSLCPVKEMHPDILEAKIYADGRLIASKKRLFQWVYKKFFYKPLPVEQNATEQKPVEEQNVVKQEVTVEKPKITKSKPKAKNTKKKTKEV